MHLSTSRLHGGRKGGARPLVLLAMGLLGAGVLNLAGCPAPTYPQMFSGVTLPDITKITTDQSLTSDQKKKDLQNLGITDEQVLYFLLNATLPTTSTTTG